MATNTFKMNTPPWPANIATFDAIDVRKTMIAALLAHSTDRIQGIPGQLSGGSGLTYAGTTVYVSENLFVVNGASATNGSYIVHVDQTQVPTSTADTTYDRMDSIYVTVFDNYIDSSGLGQASLVYAQGTPAATPTPPTLPSNSLLLANVLVPKSGSPVYTWVAPLSALNSSVITCTSTTRPTTNYLRPGALIFETDTGLLQAWSGTAWVQSSFRDRVTVCTSTSHPVNPAAGDLIFETNTGKTYIYSGSSWTGIGGGAKVVTSGNRPSNPSAGDVLFESDTQNIYIYNGSAWSLAGGDAKVVTAGGRPANPVAGDIVFESDTNNLYVYNGSAWSVASDNSSICTSTTRPSSPLKGDQIWETDTSRLYVYDGSAWQWANGTIVDSGSNANGRYVRFSDGTMICTIQTTQSVALNNAYGSLYQGTWDWTFPYAFKAAPAVSCGTFAWGTGASWGAVNAGASATKATLRGIDASSRAAGNCSISAIAVGTWK